MKILFFTLLLFSQFLFSKENIKAYAIGIFDKNGNGENIQHKKSTKNDYNGFCFSKIVIFGFVSNKNIQVKIGDSIGYLKKSSPIYDKKAILIGHEYTFEHFNISKGYFEIKIDNKLLDTKVFVK